MNKNQSNKQKSSKTKAVIIFFILKFRHFLRWSAGADNRLLDQCPGEQLKFTASGVMVVIISCVAIVSFRYFFNQNFVVEPWEALLGGFGGAFVIYNLDRLVLVYHRKGEDEWRRAASRLLLTVALSFVLIDPLILHSFVREIDVQMKVTSQSVVTQARETAVTRYQKEKDELTAANQTLQTRLDGTKQVSEAKRKELIGEIEGATGSGIPGRGRTAAEKQAAFDEADAEYKSLKKEIGDEIGKNNQRLQEIKQAIEDEVKLIAGAQSNSTGGLAQHQALFSIIWNNPSALIKVIPLFLVCFLFETSPLLLKIMAKPGKYDALLEAEETDGRAEVKDNLDASANNRRRFRESQNAVADRISESVSDSTVDDLDSEEEKDMARVFRLIILRKLARDLFDKDDARRKPDFGASITVLVSDKPEWEFVVQPPALVRDELTLENLEGDFTAIVRNISAKEKKQVSISKVTNSKGFEIWDAIPLLPQLETDAKILLTLATNNFQSNGAGLAPKNFMNVSNNFRKILRAVGFGIGLPLLTLGCLLSLLLGQIGVVGIADRFGISPLVGFNALNILMIGLFAGFLLFIKRQSDSPGFVRRLRQAVPRFGFPNIDFGSWNFPGFGETSAETKTAFASRLVKEPICKILFIHYQSVVQNDTADNSNFDSQNGRKTYAKTNNF